MEKEKQEKKKSDLKQFAIECKYDDGYSNKYVIFRRNYYEAKEEAAALQDDYNQEHSPKITGFFVKEIYAK